MRRSLVLALIALAAVTSPALGQPDPEQGFGLNVQSLVRNAQSFPESVWPQYLGLMAADGLRVARTDALWGRAEPTAPDGGGHHYDWGSHDAIARNLATAGLRWDVVLDGTPKWASTDPTNPYASPTPDHYDDFAAYTAAFVARYGPGGAFWAEHPELPSLPVSTVEIWNEPNTQVHWGSAPDPAAYAELYRRALPAVKAAAPGMVVDVGGIVWNDDAAYLKGVLGALGPDVPIDGVGSHPYAPTVFSIVPNVVRMRKVLDDAGRRDVPLLLNELGWPAAYDRAPAKYAAQGPVTDAARAATTALAVDALSRSTCHVSNIMIYDLVEGERDPAHVESLMGLYRRDGSTTLTSAALRDAVARYRATGARDLPVPVCGARGLRATRLLPLGLTARRLPSGCQQIRATYRGMPIEEVQAHVLAPYRGVRPTDADGHAELCPQKAGEPPLRIVGEIDGVARSNQLLCAKTCRAIGPGAACALRNVSVPRSVLRATLLRKGLRIRVSGCEPQEGGRVALRVRLIARDRTTAKASLSVGRSHASLRPGSSVTMRTRLSAQARRRLAHARRRTLIAEVTAVEAGTKDTVAKTVSLRPA